MQRVGVVDQPKMSLVGWVESSEPTIVSAWWVPKTPPTLLPSMAQVFTPKVLDLKAQGQPLRRNPGKLVTPSIWIYTESVASKGSTHHLIQLFQSRSFGILLPQGMAKRQTLGSEIQHLRCIFASIPNSEFHTPHFSRTPAADAGRLAKKILALAVINREDGSHCMLQGKWVWQNHLQHNSRDGAILWAREVLMPDLVEALTETDRLWLAQLEQHALSRLRGYLGDNLRLGHTEADLERIQFMLDDGVFDAEGSDDLDSFGVILGNVFQARTTMKWAIVTNNFGRNIAIHDSAIGFTLYPVQMITVRVRDGRDFRVLDLYHGFVRDLGISR
jgi:hypothetical protein